MPRQARLDAPGTLHHVIVRGIERREIVRDDQDRAAFVARMGAVATATQTIIYAWALLPNHAHLLLRSGPQGLPTFMRRVLTGYATRYNRRHRRHGHLFQNRYKSIVCEEDAYFRELVRYIHLNPVRVKLVAGLAQLARYPWSGHAGVVGRVDHAWQDRQYVLSWFGRDRATAIATYRRYMQEGIPQGRRPELVGGGLIRSLGGWAEVRAMRRRGQRALADARILGREDFVARMLEAADERLTPEPVRAQRHREATRLVHTLCRREDIRVEELQAGSRRKPVAEVRARIAVHLVTRLGLPLAEAARHLGVSTSGIAKVITRATK